MQGKSRDVPGKRQRRNHRGFVKVAEQENALYSTRLAGDEHTAASICQGLRRDAANLTESLGRRFSCLNGYKSPLGQRVRENPLD